MIDIDSFTSEATRLLGSKHAELEDLVAERHKEAEQSALLMSQTDLRKLVAEELGADCVSRMTSHEELALQHADHHVSTKSAANTELQILRRAAAADRKMAERLNAMISQHDKVEEEARKRLATQLLAPHLAGSPTIGDLPKLWHLHNFASKVATRYQAGTEFRVAVRMYFGDALAATLAYPDRAFSEGVSPEASRAHYVARARGAAEFISAVGDAYCADRTMTLAVSDLFPPF